MRFCPILLAGLLLPAAARAAPPHVTIDATATGVRITYDLPAPVRTLAIRAATQSGPPQGTHIAVAEPGLAYRRGRVDGLSPFRRVTLDITPDESEVDSVYPLLTRIAGRGFVLFAPYVVPDTPFSARVATGGGRTRALSRTEAIGGYVLVGATPASRGGFRTLASTTTSSALEARFHARAAALLDFYAARLHRRLARPPLLIVSIVDEPADRQHHFFRGDVTPNGVVLLRYHGTADQIADPNSIRQFTSFLAHELVHLWNRRRGDFPVQEAWLHEGSAEYLGWLAVAALWPGEIALERNLQNALTNCGVFLGERALSRLDQGDAMAKRYTCGPAVNWLADLAVRAASGGRRDAFDLWTRLVARGDYSMADFRNAVARLGPGATPLIRAFVDGGGGGRWQGLAAFASHAGAAVEAGPASAAMIRFPAARAIVMSACGDFWGAGDTDVEYYVSAPTECSVMSGRVTLLRVDGVDPMQAQAFHDRVRQRCAGRRSLPLTVRSDGPPRDIVVTCTSPVEEPFPELRVRRALPLSPPARSAP